MPKEVIEWIIETTKRRVHNQTEAMNFIRLHVGELVDGLHTLAATDSADGEYELYVIHAEERQTYEDDGFDVYDGAMVG